MTTLKDGLAAMFAKKLLAMGNVAEGFGAADVRDGKRASTISCCKAGLYI